MSTSILDRRWPWVLAALAIVLVFLSTFVELRLPTPRDPRPVGTVDDIAGLSKRSDLNVLFILVDTLRAEHLSAWGYARDTSPALDRIAAGGVRFARQLSQSTWTKCSMASLWTGMYPVRTGVTRFNHVIPDQARMPAEILRDAGFKTAGIYRNGWVATTFGFDQGFDVYLRPAAAPVPASVKRENPTITARGTDQDVIDSAIEFLRVNGRQRWFLYLHMMDVHEYTYDQQSAIFGSDYADIYDNSIRWLDRVIGDFYQYLGEQGYLDHTLVVISSDHGEAFRERGFEGHARKVYRETTEVPFILSFPFRLDPGVTVDVRTRNVDVWPTVLDLLGLEVPDQVDGHSLVPEILDAAHGVSRPDDGIAVAFLDQNWGKRQLGPNPTVAVTQGTLRYVRTGEGDGRALEQLFDSSVEPHELEDVAEKDPEALERLRADADAYLEMKPPWGEAPEREIDEMELNQLRALGYAIP